MGRFTQAGRALRLDVSGLGEDDLLLKAFHGQESISRLYHFDLQLYSEDPAIEFQSVIGQEARIELVLPDDSVRHIAGVISAFSQGGSTIVNVGGNPAVFAFYEATLAPWIWRLTLRSNCRVFQNLSVPEIVTQILDEHDIGRHRMRTTGSYPKREYCVQYRESDFNFVSRLLEEEGIFYFFEHSEEGHMMILGDQAVTFRPCPDHSTASFAPQLGSSEADGVITDWQLTRQEHTIEFTHRDFKFQQPDLDLTAQSGEHQAMSEVYDYPGEYKSLDRGRQLADVRMAQEEMPGVTITGAGYAGGFTPGFKFELDRHYRPDFNAEYVLTTVSHTADLGSNYVNVDRSEFVYRNLFQCIPSKQPFRPLRLTPSPVIHGTQTAIVVGPPGEEIFVDEFGRVKVQFHWDREGKRDEKSSCFIRVSQYWAGDKWGSMHIPRIGQEVIVDFLEGDPDQPIIVGRVYNGNSRPPYDLPKFQTVSTVKSNSTKGGKGFNELRFEDKKGKEQVFIHSQKRMDVRVRQSLYETNHANRHVVVGWKDDDSGKHGGNYAITVGGDRDIHVWGGLYERVEKKLNQSVVSDVVYDFGANEGEFVKAKRELNAREVIVESLQGITLKVGGNFVKIDLAGVTIKGTIVRINSGGSASSTGSADIEDPVDADVADNGQPGWLDRPRPAGTGGGRRKRKLNGYHAPAVPRNAAGNYQFTKSVQVSGSDPDYAGKVLGELALIGTTAEGKNLFNNLDNSGRNVTISRFDPFSGTNNPPNPPNAFATAGNGQPADFQNATPNGQPVFDGNGNPINDAAGNQLIGTGTGTDSQVTYHPEQWPAAGTRTQAPGDAILFHELTHSSNMGNGTYDGSPRTDNFDTNEEFNTIGPENRYRDERGVPRRNDHHDL